MKSVEVWLPLQWKPWISSLREKSLTICSKTGRSHSLELILLLWMFKEVGFWRLGGGCTFLYVWFVIPARDHGIPPYNNYRALCNLKRARSWNDLSREIPSEVIARFQKIYDSVDDIDLFPGAMSERPLQGGLVGPTLACIIGIQFRQLRKCDRFW